MGHAKNVHYSCNKKTDSIKGRKNKRSLFLRRGRSIREGNPHPESNIIVKEREKFVNRGEPKTNHYSYKETRKVYKNVRYMAAATIHSNPMYMKRVYTLRVSKF